MRAYAGGPVSSTNLPRSAIHVRQLGERRAHVVHPSDGAGQFDALSTKFRRSHVCPDGFDSPSHLRESEKVIERKRENAG